MSETASERNWGFTEWASVVIGGIVGFLLDWFAIAVGILVTYIVYGDTGSGPGPYVAIIAGFVAVPAIVCFLLAKRSLRVPFLIGVAVGSIVGSGVCAGTWWVNG